MPYHWPEDTDFALWELDVLDRSCSTCGRTMYVCDHRHHRIFCLDGPAHLVCKLNHCPDPRCPGHRKTVSPEAEASITMPYWVLGWDVFCWIGHRRFARHWSVPQIRGELLDAYKIPLSSDAIEKYIRRYQTMLAARQQDPERLRQEYQSADHLILSIDGLQPEKGHETLYVVRELTRKRVWFAEALLSATASEVRRLIAQAREWAERLGKPVKLWISDKQDAFVTGIAGGVRRRPASVLCQPLPPRPGQAGAGGGQPRQGADAEEGAWAEVDRGGGAGSAAARDGRCPGFIAAPLRGSRRGGPGLLLRGPWHPQRRPGRATPAAGLADVRSSGRGQAVPGSEPGGEKGGRSESLLSRLAGFIDRGLDAVEESQVEIRGHVDEIAKVWATLDPAGGPVARRRADFAELRDRLGAESGPIRRKMSALMGSFEPGLFAGGDDPDLPRDNLDLERWFRNPKGHERRIHGHRHAGVRIVQEGPTLLLALDAHLSHPEVFDGEDLRPYHDARPPRHQLESIHRRKVMRKARSKKMRGPLLAELERRYLASS